MQLFGGRGGDRVQDALGNSLSGQGTFWSLPTGGSQHLDLYDTVGAALANSTVQADANGRWLVQNPDDSVLFMWADFGSGRFLVETLGLADRLLGVESLVASVQVTVDLASDAAQAALTAANASREFVPYGSGGWPAKGASARTRIVAGPNGVIPATSGASAPVGVGDYWDEDGVPT